ncbi:MAG: hypothetical protein QOD84_3116 [Acidobacteriaceae bacterium]|jgi:uncharacterized membrane protein
MTVQVSAKGHLRLRRALWIGLILLCVIAAGAATRRITALAFPPRSSPPQIASLDEAFAKKPALTLAHVVPALLLVVLVPFQFSRSFRSRHIQIHRWMGRTIMALGLLIGVSALALIRHPVGGATEVAAILCFDGIFLLALTKALLYIRRGQVELHREWVIRAMSVALGVATVRPVMAIFFATSRLTGLALRDFFGIAFWIGFTATYIVAEAWIRYTKDAV